MEYMADLVQSKETFYVLECPPWKKMAEYKTANILLFSRGIFTTLPNIYDEIFNKNSEKQFRKPSTQLQISLNMFHRKKISFTRRYILATVYDFVWWLVVNIS